MAKQWSVVPRAPGERERLIADALAELKNLQNHEVMKIYHSDSEANLNLEIELADLDINRPRPPVTFFWGERSRKDVEQNIAEWKVYGLDMKWLIEQHHKNNEASS